MAKTLACLALVATALMSTPAMAKPKPSPLLVPVADAAAEVVKGKLPPAATTITVSPLVGSDGGFAPLLERALRKLGFAVAVDAQGGAIEVVHYDVLPIREGVVLGLEIAGERTTRLLRQTENGSLVVTGPVIVKETDR